MPASPDTSSAVNCPARAASSADRTCPSSSVRPTNTPPGEPPAVVAIPEVWQRHPDVS